MELEVAVNQDNAGVADWQPERSLSSEALMNLLLRFETAIGPRTVIACSVPRHVAAAIAEVMKSTGQHAEFIDRCSPLSVADRLMIKKLH